MSHKILNYEFHEEGMFSAGKRAGWITSSGYRELRVNGKRTREHRLIYEHTYGPISEGYQIHHLNGTRDDNRLTNLICLTPKQHCTLDQRNTKTETREKMSAAKMGTHQSAEHRANSTAARMGKSRGSGVHPTKCPNGTWYARFGFCKNILILGSSRDYALLQGRLDFMRATIDIADELPSIASMHGLAKQLRTTTFYEDELLTNY